MTLSAVAGYLSQRNIRTVKRVKEIW
jgi:hypothetical protein